MEKTEKNFFYLGVEEEAVFQSKRMGLSGRRSKAWRQGIPIKKLHKRLRLPGGSLQIYYGLLPEYEGIALFSRRKKHWNKEHLQQMADATLVRAKQEWDCSETVFAAALAGRDCELPSELFAACLQTFAPFEQVCVSFSEEGGTHEGREVILLLLPYLRRMRQVVLIGEECPASELLSEYLYYEFGLVLSKQNTVPPGVPWLNLFDQGTERRSIWKNRGEIWQINRAETLKFLDTAVKNGYNTES